MCGAFSRRGCTPPGKRRCQYYFFQSFAKASAASFSARSFCECALSVRLRRGLTRSRRASAAVRERLSWLPTTTSAASKIISGSKLSGFDDVLMRRLHAHRRFPTIQAMWEWDVGKVRRCLVQSFASRSVSVPAYWPSIEGWGKRLNCRHDNPHPGLASKKAVASDDSNKLDCKKPAPPGQVDAGLRRCCDLPG